MSFIEEILDCDVSAHSKIVAIAICRYRNRKTGECYPSLQLLSETLRLSQNTVQRCLRELEDKKIIEINKIRKFTSTINNYQFLTKYKALPKVDTSKIDVSKIDVSKIDTSVDTSVDTSNHTSNFEVTYIEEPKEPKEPSQPTTAEKNENRFAPRKDEITAHGIRILKRATMELEGFINSAKPEMLHAKCFIELLDAGYTGEQIGGVVLKIKERFMVNPPQRPLQSWAYVKTAVIEEWKDAE